MNRETPCSQSDCSKSCGKKRPARHAQRKPIVVRSVPRAVTLPSTSKQVALLDGAALPLLFSTRGSFRANSLEELTPKRLKNWVTNLLLEQGDRSTYAYLNARSRYSFPRAMRALGVTSTLQQHRVSAMLDRIMGAHHLGDDEIIELYREHFTLAGIGFLVEVALEVAEYERKELVNYA